VKYIHSINPELMLLMDKEFDTPLGNTISDFYFPKCDFFKAVYALEPKAISKVQFYMV